MNTKIYLYIAVCAGVSFLIRELPLTLIRRPIRNRFLRSFLFYVPYVTLAVMTFPSILHTTSSPAISLPVSSSTAPASSSACRSRPENPLTR